MTGLTLKRLEAFVCVAECGSFSEAAERMYLSQPAVSGAIAALETTLGVTLLERGRRKRILLTPQGQETYRRSKEILRSCQRLEEAFTSEETVLTIGASTMPMEVLLPPLLAAFHRKHPQCRFVLRSGNSAEPGRFRRRGQSRVRRTAYQLRSRECCRPFRYRTRTVRLWLRRRRGCRQRSPGAAYRQLRR